MKRTIIALAACATLALTACGGGDSEPTATKTVTQDAKSAKNAPKKDETDKAEEAEGDSSSPLDEIPDPLPEFDSVKDIASHEGLNGIIEHDGANCEADITTEGVRTADGNVAQLDVALCWSEQVSGEMVQFAYSDDANGEALMEWINEYDPEWEASFMNDGGMGDDAEWAIVADSEGMLADIMEGLGIDPKQWGVGLTDEEINKMAGNDDLEQLDEGDLEDWDEDFQ